MKKYTILLLLTLLLTSCSLMKLKTKVELKKVNLSDTNLTFHQPTFTNFESAFRTLHPVDACALATTNAQKIATEGLEYMMQSEYEKAIETFAQAATEIDSLTKLWGFCPSAYYTQNYDWEKLEQYDNMIGNTDSMPAFYKDKPKFQIDYSIDSVVIPLSFQQGIPMIKIEINGKYYIFELDTGFGLTVIGQNVASNSNCIYDSSNTMKVQAIDGFVTFFSGILSEINLESIKISNFPVTVSNEKYTTDMTFLFIPFFRCDGVIGFDLLSKFDFTIDYKNEQLVLRKPTSRNIANKNLFYYQYSPFVRFYCNGYPLTFFFDTGSAATYVNASTITKAMAVDTNNLVASRVGGNGAASDTTVAINFHEYPNFQCYTIANNTITILNVEQAWLQSGDWILEDIIEIQTDVLLGSNWLQNKAVRVDITNGIFEIYE